MRTAEPTKIHQGTTRYRPTVADMMDVSKFQTLTLSTCPASAATTGWSKVCADRAARGISRKARIAAKRGGQ